MIREGIRPLTVLAVAALAAAILAACGSSSSDSSSTTSTEASVPTSSTQSQPQKSPTKSGAAKGQGRSREGSQSQSGKTAGNHSSGKSVKEVETPLKVSGGGSAQFRTKGGDNSIQEFGEESDESELQEAAEAVHGFYVASTAEEWQKACSYLAKSNVEQLERLAKSAKTPSTGCAPVLKAFTQPLSAAVAREVTTVDAGSLRHEGEQGFLIYFGAGHVTYAMPLRDEDGTWKVAALSGTVLG